MVGLLAPVIMASAVTVAFAQSGSASAFNAVCAKMALEKRDYITNSAVNAFVVSFKSAVSQRATNLLSAFSITNAKDRQVAVKSAMTNFRQSKKAAYSNFSNTLRWARKTFASDINACGETNALDYENEGDDL